MPLPVLLIDARRLDRPLTGVQRYTLNLIRAAALRANPFSRTPTPSGCGSKSVHVLVRDREHLTRHLDEPPPRGVCIHEAPRRLSRRGWRKLLTGIGPTGVVLHPDVIGPLLPHERSAGWERVVTLHDVIPLLPGLDLRGSKKAMLRPLWRAYVKHQCRIADRVVTVSHASAADLQRVLHIPSPKLHVLHNAVVPPPLPAPSTPPPREPGLMLCVGRFDPYKGTADLVSAFGQTPEAFQRSRRLVFVGPPDPRFPEAGWAAAALPATTRSRVTFAGSVSEAELWRLYRTAGLLVSPSRYEGFGLPMAEAASVGTPVVSIDHPAARELAAELQPAPIHLTPPDLLDEALIAAAELQPAAPSTPFTLERLADQLEDLLA